MERKALGKGLGALISPREGRIELSPSLKEEKEKIIYLDVEEVKPSSLQPRQEFDAQALEELAASIKEKGFIQPLLVRKVADGYELIAGERRLRAAKSLKIKKIPAMVKEAKDEEALELSLIENLQRENLNPIEEAAAFKELMERFNLTQEKIAQLIGKARTSIANSLRLLSLPLDIQEEIRKRRLSFGHAKVLLSVLEPQTQRNLARRVLSNSLSVRELENLIRPRLKRKKRPYHIELKDLHLAAIEEELQHLLGTKVRIIQQRKRGRIQIEFYSQDEFERILEVLKGK